MRKPIFILYTPPLTKKVFDHISKAVESTDIKSDYHILVIRSGEWGVEVVGLTDEPLYSQDEAKAMLTKLKEVE